MAPEYRDFRFITLSPKDFREGLTATAEEIDAEMGTAAGVADANETRDFDQILFDDEEAANAAYSELQGGKTFADAIIDSGSTAEDASVLDNTKQEASDSYGSESAEAIFTLEQGSYSAPVETDFGWRIFSVTRISGPAEATDTTALRTEAEDRIITEKALGLLFDKSELIEDELAAGGTLADVASILSLELKTALNVDFTGYNSKGDLVASIPTNPEFLSKVFESLEGDEPFIEDLGGDEYYLLVVDNVQERALRPYEEVKNSVFDIWQADARRDKAREKATEILTKAQEGVALADLSKTASDTTYNAVTLTRNDQTGAVARSIQNSIFTQSVGGAEILPAADSNGFVVVKVLSRTLPEDTMSQAQTEQLKALLIQEYEQRFLSNYWQYLETNLPVKVNQRAIDSVHALQTSQEQ